MQASSSCGQPHKESWNTEWSSGAVPSLAEMARPSIPHQSVTGCGSPQKGGILGRKLSAAETISDGAQLLKSVCSSPPQQLGLVLH